MIAGMTLGYFIKPTAPSEDHLAMIKNKAIVHKVGSQHEGHLQEIIDEMYQQWSKSLPVSKVTKTF